MMQNVNVAFFRDLPLSTEIVYQGVKAVKFAPKKAMAENGIIFQIKDSEQVATIKPVKKNDFNGKPFGGLRKPYRVNGTSMGKFKAKGVA